MRKNESLLLFNVIPDFFFFFFSLFAFSSRRPVTFRWFFSCMISVFLFSSFFLGLFANQSLFPPRHPASHLLCTLEEPPFSFLTWIRNAPVFFSSSLPPFFSVCISDHLYAGSRFLVCPKVASSRAERKTCLYFPSPFFPLFSTCTRRICGIFFFKFIPLLPVELCMMHLLCVLLLFCATASHLLFLRDFFLL